MGKKITCEQVHAIINAVVNGKATIKELSTQYSISKSTVHNILYARLHYGCFYEALENREDFIENIKSILKSNTRLSKGRGKRSE